MSCIWFIKCFGVIFTLLPSGESIANFCNHFDSLSCRFTELAYSFNLHICGCCGLAITVAVFLSKKEAQKPCNLGRKPPPNGGR